MKAFRPQGYRDGGSQWAIPQADVDRWLADGDRWLADGDRWLADGSFSAGPEAFRATMRHHAKGVAIVTAGLDEPIGFCATSLASVCLDPPIMAFTVGLRSSSWPVVEAARHVMVHLLAADQAELATRFGQREVPRFGPQTAWHRDGFGLPVLDDALAWMVVAPASHLPVGDHALVVGRVIACRQVGSRPPLVHLRGEFGSATGPDGCVAL